MKIKLFALFMLAVVVLSACGGDGNTANDTPLNQPPVPSQNNSENSPTADQSNEQTGENQPATQPLPPDDAGDGQTASVSFANDVFPILNSRCITCHGGDRIEGELVMLSYAELMSGGKDGAVIIPGDAEGSLLYQLTSTGKMPKRGANLNPAQLQIIMQWINAGAPNN